MSQQREGYLAIIATLQSEKKDCLDRLFAKENIAPTGIDLTECYQERQQRERERKEDPNSKKKQPVGPIEQLESKWADDDRQKVERLNWDATKPRNLVN